MIAMDQMTLLQRVQRMKAGHPLRCRRPPRQRFSSTWCIRHICPI